MPKVNSRNCQVVETFDELVPSARPFRSLRVNNDPELTGRTPDQRTCLHGVKLDFSPRGYLIDNTHIKAINTRLQAACLNGSWFLSMADTQARNTPQRGGMMVIDGTQPWAPRHLGST